MLWLIVVIVLLVLIIASFKYESPGLGILLIIVFILTILWKFNLLNEVIGFVEGFISPNTIE